MIFFSALEETFPIGYYPIRARSPYCRCFLRDPATTGRGFLLSVFPPRPRDPATTGRGFLGAPP